MRRISSLTYLINGRHEIGAAFVSIGLIMFVCMYVSHSLVCYLVCTYLLCTYVYFFSSIDNNVTSEHDPSSQVKIGD